MVTLSANSRIILESSIGTGLGTVTLSGVDTNFEDNSDLYRAFDGFYRKVGTFATQGSIITDTIYDISSADILPLPGKVNGTVQYALTYFNSVDGTESAPLLSAEIEVVNGVVQLSTLPVSSDPQVTNRKLYRIGGNVTTFTLVTTLDNVVTTYEDSLGDTELEGSLLTATNNQAPIADSEFLTENNSMLFAIDGDKLRFTPIAQPNVWPTLFFLDFPSQLTGCAKTASGLLVFDRFKTWLVTGTGPTSLAQQVLSIDQGCISHYSIAGRSTFAIWTSTDGVCMSSGGKVELLTKDRMNKLTLLPVNAVLYDQEYHVQLTNGKIFTVDFARDIFKFSDRGTESLVTANDILYGYSTNILYTLNTSANDLSLHYKSPKFTGGSLTINKTYKNVYVTIEGSFDISLYVNKTKVITKTITDSGINQIKIPKDDAVGLQIQIEAIGKGEISAINIEEDSVNG